MSRLRVFVTSTAIAAAVLTVGLAPANAAGVNYVALGDSYSSGVGSGSYTSSSGSCLRSTKAYPQLWANSHATTSFTFVACSGATTKSVISSQVPALSSATTLASISVGGNDAGFADVMLDCVLYSTSTCVNKVDQAETFVRNTLPGLLDNAYNQIRSHAPNARVVVLGYPRFYDSKWYCIGLSGTARNKINEGADVLDSVISAAASRHGFAFADVRPAFANGHEICDSNSWLHSVNWTNITESYHPKAAGQSGGYLPAFAAKA